MLAKFLTRSVFSCIGLTLVASGCEKQQTTPPPSDPVATAPAKPPAKPIPDGFFTLTPQLTVNDVDAAIAFYTTALGAQKLFTLPGADGKTMHGEIKIGDSIVMIDAENPQGKSPLTLGGTPATLMVYVEKVDEAYAAAIAAGAKQEQPVQDQFWGDRYGELSDPFGHRWALATHTEDLTPEQMQQRSALVMAEMAPPPKGKRKKKPKKGAPPVWKAVAGTPATQAVPAPYHTVTVAYTLDDAAAAIEFYKTALGAQERDRMAMPDGRIMHAEISIGDSFLMLSDEMPGMSKSAKTLAGSPVALMLYTPDVDAAMTTATGAGGTAVMPVSDMFWGDRYGAIVDVAGYLWGIATHKEDLTPEEIAERAKAAMPPAGAETAPAPAAAPAGAETAAAPTPAS